MSTTTAPRFVGDVIVHEVSQAWSRERLLLKLGFATLIGTVLGRILLAGASSAAKAGGNAGNGTLVLDATTPVLAGARAGIYTVRFTSATAFTVEGPDGEVLGNGVNGTAFSDDIKFVTTAGGTPFIAGDGFDITVAAASVEKVVPLDPTAIDGSQIPFAVAIEEKASAAADQKIVAVVRGATVDPTWLVWPVGYSDAQKAAALFTLRERGIATRASL